jgi:hypothetical protein
MKKLLLILFCLPLMFSCGEKDDKIKKLEERIDELENKKEDTENKKEVENDYKIKNKVDDLKEQKDFYISEIKLDSTELSKLKSESEEQEKFAREKFLMKKDNEDIFIIRNNEDE